jgi:glucokinase
MEKPYVIGIDIGGTNTKFGVIDARGLIVEQGGIGPHFDPKAKETGKYETVESYFAVLLPELNKLIENVGGKEKINGIGIGAPNGNYYTGTIELAPNLIWAKKEKIPFARMISYATGIPTSLTNDANAAAIGEMTYGGAKGMKHFIMITLGTGVGSGIVINGQVVYGETGFAGELGHVIVRKENGRLCGCGRRGCLETYASATGVVVTAKEFIKNKEIKTLLSECDIETITAKDVFEAAVKGDSVAIEILASTGRLLGEAFADFIAFSSPAAIILSGGLARAGDFIIKPIEEAMEEYTLDIFKKEIKVKVFESSLKDSDAAILGASALGWETKQTPE